MRTRSLLLSLFILITLTDVMAQTAAPATVAHGPSLGTSFIQMLFGLALVLGLLLGGFWVLKRLTGTPHSGGNLVKVISATPVGARERIVVVEMGQSWLVLGVTPNSINTLAELPRQALPPNVRPMPPNFADWLRNTLSQRNVR